MRASSAKLVRDERGMTIIESLFAAVVIAVAFLGMAGVQAVASKAQTLGKNQQIATSLALRDIELMRRSTYANVVAASTVSSREGVSFTVARTVTTSGQNKRVQVTTSWSDRFGSRNVTLSSLVSQVTNP